MNQRFLPELSNEDARAKFTEIIDYSVNAAFFSNVLEIMHQGAVIIKY